MKAKTIILFVLGVLFVVCIPSYDSAGAIIIGIILAVVCFYFGYRSMKKTTIQKNEAPTPTAFSTSGEKEETSPPAASAPKEKEESPYEYLRIKVAGVTFKNGRNSRQSILRAIKFRDGEFSEGVTLEIKSYEWEGQPAYGIYANGQQIGNVPADIVPYVQENFYRFVDFGAIEVYGGGRDNEGNTKNFGCEVVLRLKK